MITANAVVFGDQHKLLQFHPEEHPIALQLGGNQPELLAKAAQKAEEFGYDEINLNVGCPSDRVKSGQFGACLMLQPTVVADCIAAMKAVVKVPVTVKCRIGVDHQDSYAELLSFIHTIHQVGCETFVIHARKAWLSGLSPKQNREIPPLNYDMVRQIKKDCPALKIIINGGIKTVAEIQQHLQFVDGVMIGREAYANPYLLAEIEKTFFSPAKELVTRHEIIKRLIPYVERELAQKTKLSRIARHILGLFQGQPGARSWRRYLSENMYHASANINVIYEAIKYV